MDDLDDDDLDKEEGDDEVAPEMSGLLAAAGGGQLGGLGAMLGRAQEAMAHARQASEQPVEGSAGNGAVRVSLNGSFEFSSVSIRPEVVDSNEVELLEDLVLAALNDAASKIRAQQQQIQQQMLGGLDLGKLLGGG